MHKTWQLSEQGDRCLLVQFSDQLSLETGLRCTRAARLLRDHAPACVRDLVPSFTAVAIHFYPDGNSEQLAQLHDYVHHALAELDAGRDQAAPGALVDVPVCYGGPFGPDLPAIAEQLGLSQEQVIELHSSQVQLVFMVGFAPGAPYMGILPEQLNVPRRATPRTVLPKGSVAIANQQTIIYPNESPGGWHLIGRSPVNLFDARRSPAALLAPGDQVRFVPLPHEQFDHWTPA